MLPLRSFYLWLPWPVMLGVLAAIGYHFAGWRLALLPVCLFGFMMRAGFWEPLMLTI